MNAEDSTEVVNGLPEEPVQILTLQARAYPDGQRARQPAPLTPFQVPSNLEAGMHHPRGLLDSSTVVAVEAHVVEIELRRKDEARPGGPVARLIRAQRDQGTQDICEAPVEILPPETYS